MFIKAEGSKNKSQDMYLIVKIVDGMAWLQKLNGSKFHSKHYEVPLADIFPAIVPPSDRLRNDSPISSSDEEEDEPPPSAPTSDDPTERELPVDAR